MGKDWIVSKHVGLAMICMMGFAQVRNQTTIVYGSGPDVRSKLGQIQESFDKQWGMFRNLRFKANWYQAHVQISHDPGKPPEQMEFIEIPDEKILNKLDYHIDTEGRYLISLEQHVTDAASGEIKSQRHSAKYGFNGQTYRVFYSEKQASIFTPEQQFDNGRSLINPTHFMDHVFNEDIRYIFDHPKHVELAESADGLWILKFRDEKSQYTYEAKLDPKPDFMVVELKRTSKEGHVYEKKMEYEKTGEGFWYPVKGVRSFAGRDELIMNITEFELNVPNSDYVLEFPKGTHVRDYTRKTDPPEVYRYGVAKKNYEQIVQGGGKFVAGFVVDEANIPVIGVPVQICCHKRPRDDGRFSFTFSSHFDILNAVTDQRGRFAIELEKDGQYNLRFSPKNHAALIVYDVPLGQSDLKVTLSDGGTVTGRLLRIKDGRKVPIPSAEVKIEQMSRGSYSHLGFERNRTFVTDLKGRFRFDHLRTKMRDYSTSKSNHWEYIPRVWKISYGKTSKTVAFYEGKKIEDIELIVEPDYTNPASLVGKPLPPFENITIGFEPQKAREKRLLFCFFDMNQRPSRNCTNQLAKQAEKLKRKGVTLAAVQTSMIEKNDLDTWIKQNEIPFPVGMIKGKEENVRFNWGIKSLPWLILTDHEHVVTAEGFALQELDDKLKAN